MTYYKTDDGKVFFNLVRCQMYCFNSKNGFKTMSTNNPLKVFWLLITCT